MFVRGDTRSSKSKRMFRIDQNSGETTFVKEEFTRLERSCSLERSYHRDEDYFTGFNDSYTRKYLQNRQLKGSDFS